MSDTVSLSPAPLPVELLRYEAGIHAIDSGYYRPQLDAIHLIVDAGEVAIIDTGTGQSVPRVLEALRLLGVSPSAVRHLLLTHVHLDHAAGAGALMQHLPHARLGVHERGARHIADPSRLWAATIDVYGEAHVARSYGSPVPVDAARIDVLPDGAELSLGRRRIGVLDTPGHARHHLAFVDSASGHVFSGDIFGLSYRELDQAGHPFIIPTSSPSQFDPAEAHRSIDRILALAPDAVYLTHYAQVRGIARLGAMLHRLVDAYVALGERCRHDEGAARQARLHDGMKAVVLAEARSAGLRHADETILSVLGLDIELNAQGLANWIDASLKQR